MRQTNPPIEVRFESLTLDDLDAVMRIERLAYAYPWSRAVFEDTAAACWHDAAGLFCGHEGR